jgi:hypothetical protein
MLLPIVSASQATPFVQQLLLGIVTSNDIDPLRRALPQSLPLIARPSGLEGLTSREGKVNYQPAPQRHRSQALPLRFGWWHHRGAALLLTSLKGAMLAYLVNSYLAFIGALIVYRVVMNYTRARYPANGTVSSNVIRS